ncbi:uncharacterized protein LOC133311789 [Gastrolobium bilobum]|uniref:uncharacterized protein LOC133311789 n=1 Tax=Gastrolobium bilobum TaxID=150636 RepID=UPI002AB03E5D|nr:uncharacterized protein LOC133311789 [Gastrolobium bilobum]
MANSVRRFCTLNIGAFNFLILSGNMRLQEVAEELGSFQLRVDRTLEEIQQKFTDHQNQFQTINTQIQQMHAVIVGGDIRTGEHAQPRVTPGTSSNDNNGVVHSRYDPNDPRNIMKSIKIELPSFMGTDPVSWIFRTEMYFGLHQIPESLKVRLAGMKMEGMAGPWFQWLFSGGSIQSWEELKSAVKHRFGGIAYTDLRGVLSKLTQVGTLSEYIRDFEALINQVTDFSDEVLMSFFVSGLFPDLKRGIQLHKPTSLHQAMQLAMTYEAHFAELRGSFSSYNKKFTPKPISIVEQCNATIPQVKPMVSTLPALPSNVPVKKVSQEYLQKRRDMGLCYTCDEKWNSKHRCKARMMMLVGDFDEAETELEEQIVWQPDQGPQEILDAALHSMGSDLNPRALQFHISIGSRLVTILIDSGSTHNFVQKNIAEELGLPMIKVPRMRVFLGNGEFLTCERKCPSISLNIQGQVFVVDLWVIELTQLGIVLGICWLSSLGRVIHDYSEMSMEFVWNHKRIILVGENKNEDSKSREGICNALTAAVVSADSSAHQLPELLLLQDQVPSAVWHVLMQYQSVFQLPQGLPPSRACDHAIHLVEGAKLLV